jgi:hypothetical protein
MPGTHAPYPQEFREQMVALVRSGRTPRQCCPRSCSRYSRTSCITSHASVRWATVTTARRHENRP